MNNLAEVREEYDTLKEIKNVLDIDKFDSSELEELLANLGTNDFEVSLDGGEYRFISQDAIKSIYYDSIVEMIEDCYFTDDMPALITCHIDWDGIVSDCSVDGYGHHFSGYDGSEEEAGNYYIFRTN